MNRRGPPHRDRRGVALDQIADGRRKRRVVDDIAWAAAAVLAAPALLTRERALLIHVPQDHVGFVAPGRHPDLRVVVVRPGASGQAERGALPLTAGRDLHRTRWAEPRTPAADLAAGGG